MSLVWIALALLGVLIVVALYYGFAKEQIFRLSRYEYWSDRFYSAAKPLVTNPETPPSLISTIETLNEVISERWAPLSVERVFRKKIQEGGWKQSPSATPADEKTKEFFTRFPELLHKAQVVSHAGLMAAGYAHWMGGVQARAILADTFAEMELRQDEISDVADVRNVKTVDRGPSLVPLVIRR